MSRIKSITKIVVDIFTCLLLILLAFVIYGKIVLTFKNTYPNYFGYTFFEVASGSMEPTLQLNDVILIKIDEQDLKKGDIIAFLDGETIVTHRIIYMDGDVITVKGDNNNVVDKPIIRRQVIGKMVKVIPKLGVWKKVITEPKILVAIFITLLLFDFALSYKKTDLKKEKNKKKDVKDEVIIKEVPVEEKAPVSKKTKRDVVESEKLLELTRKIDIDEINRLLEGTEYKLEKKEINNLKKEISKIEDKKQDNKEDKELNIGEKEKKFIEYTMRLDLTQIQKKINSKVK